MPRIVTTEEIDFDKFESCSTFESALSFGVNRVKTLGTYYTGNKKKLLYWIARTIDSSGSYNSIIDVFAGSHVFSLLMKFMGKSVLCNDILVSSHLNGLAFVENNSYVLTEEDKTFLLKHNNKNVKPFVSINFDDLFNKNEAAFLDNFAQNLINRFSPFQTDKQRHLFAVALASMQIYIMKNCFKGGFLYKGQILSRKDHRIKINGSQMKFVDITWKDFIYPEAKRAEAVCFDAIELLNKKQFFDVAYIDPPYGGAQSDYSEMYNFFEEYIGYMKIPWLKPNRSKNKNVKKFCKSKSYKENFEKLIYELKDIPRIVISYNDSSWSDIETIKGIVSTFRDNIDVHVMDYKYQYRSKSSSKGLEYLLIAS